MMTWIMFTRRNVKLFFKDKGMFFASLITPAILLVLYATFLGNVYRDSFISAMPEGVDVSGNLIDGVVGGQLVSSILAVSSVTVAFCSNLLMVQDKAKGTIMDMRITPAKPAVLSAGYVTAALISTLIICFVSAGICLGYVRVTGWYMSASDVAMLFLDVLLLASLGTALSSVVNFFLSTEGQISAVSSIISAGYGFICGGYMPISSFGEGIREAVMFLPGTYGTSLIRNHCLGGVMEEMQDSGVPGEVVTVISDFLDCNLYFADEKVPEAVKYIVLIASICVLMLVFVMLSAGSGRRKLKR